ncbi:MAG: hypothetical protein AAF939_10665 [Planctomycetota bacterium]
MKNLVVINVKLDQVAIWHQLGSNQVDWDSADDGSLVAAISSLTSEIRRSGQRFVLGLPSHSFYCLDGLPESNDWSTLCFDLEVDLPVDAESMVPVSMEKLTLVLDSGPYVALLKRLENELGIVFDVIIPASWLLADSILRQEISKQVNQVIVANKTDCDLFLVHEGSIRHWEYYASSIDELPSFQSVTWADVILIQDNAQTEIQQGCLAVDSIADCLDRAQDSFDQPKFVELADRFYQKHRINTNQGSVLEKLVASIMLLLVLGSIALLIRSNQWQSYADQSDFQLRRLVKQSVPGLRINGPMERLLSKQIELEKNLNELVGYQNQSTELVDLFRRFLGATRQDIPLRIDKLDVYPNRISVTGEVKSIKDLELLKANFVEEGFNTKQNGSYGKQFEFELTPTDEDNDG